MIDPLSEKAQSVAVAIKTLPEFKAGYLDVGDMAPLILAALHDVQREHGKAVVEWAAARSWLEIADDKSLLDALAESVARARINTLQQDAAWMRHKPDCAVTSWATTRRDPLHTPMPDCTCGLSTRLQEIQK